MEHVTEFEMEMLVLDGPLGIIKRNAIERHLADCGFCRKQKMQISAFYEEVVRQFNVENFIIPHPMFPRNEDNHERK